MDDWEDAGLVIGIVVVLFMCCIMVCWKIRCMSGKNDEFLLDNPV